VSDYVTDTHALYWYLTASLKLGATAQGVFLNGEQGKARIHIPTIVLAELYYLNVKYRRPLEFTQEYQRLVNAGQFRFVDFRAEDVLRFDALAAIPEMHDRIITGVAYVMNLPLLTRDPEIIGSKLIQTIW
jgi:PIN domain nuclease of toxin-antitoxin system